MACFNSGHRIEDHFADVSKMVGIGSGAGREIKVTLLSRYACYLVIQNADPKKEIVAYGQNYFAIQTRRQELADEYTENELYLTCAPDGKLMVDATARKFHLPFEKLEYFPKAIELLGVKTNEARAR
jgi:hypothetical protein